jgi:hypothetical protein
MGVERKVHIDGLDIELTQTIEERVSQFERKHEPDVLCNGPGWVPRIRKIDYAIAIGINAAIVLWLVIALSLN